MPEEVNKPRSEFLSALRKYDKTTALTYLCVLLIILTTASLFTARSARDDASEAKATATTWQQMYKETERECRLAQLEIDDFKITLIRAGFDIEHEGESP